jgi:hypothetical protein
MSSENAATAASLPADSASALLAVLDDGSLRRWE